MSQRKRILIIRRKALGDVLVSMAVPAALRRAWPEARIDLVVDRLAAPVAQGSPYVDQLLIYDRRRYQTGDPQSRLRAASRWMRRLRRLRYDIVLDLMGTPQTALWTRVTGAQIRVGRIRRWRTWAYTLLLPRDRQPRFAGEMSLDWVRALGVEPGPWTPTPIPRPEELDAAMRDELRALRRPGRPLIVLSPGSTWAAKAWPPRNYAQLGRLLRDRMDADVLVAWGPGEESIRDVVLELAEGSVRALPPTDLKSLASILGMADLLITGDGGPKHIAVAEGTPTLTLFGSTDPRGWQPKLDGHRWLSNDVPCRPCDLRECIVPGHPCLDDLSSRRVADEAEHMLAEVSEEAGA